MTKARQRERKKIRAKREARESAEIGAEYEAGLRRYKEQVRRRKELLAQLFGVKDHYTEEENEAADAAETVEDAQIELFI